MEFTPLSKDETTKYFEDAAGPNTARYLASFKDRNIEKIFTGKVFVVYKIPEKESCPKVKTLVTVKGVGIENGDLCVCLYDEKLAKMFTYTNIPNLLSGMYPIRISVPSECRLVRTIGRDTAQKIVDMGLTAIMLIKHKSKPEFKTPGQTSFVSVGRFRSLFDGQAAESFELLEKGVERCQST